MPDESPGSSLSAPPRLGALFGNFFLVGVLGFGGVLPLARRMIVEQRRWLSAAEFNDVLSLCQFLPGANIVNVSVALGGRWHGPLGALAAIVGLLAAPIGIVIALGAVYLRYRDVAPVAHGFAGLAAAASGLVLATALRIAAPLRRRPVAIVVALAALAGVAVLRLPLLLVLLVLAPAAMLLQRPRA